MWWVKGLHNLLTTPYTVPLSPLVTSPLPKSAPAEMHVRYIDRSQTLEDAGLFPSATLFVSKELYEG